MDTNACDIGEKNPIIELQTSQEVLDPQMKQSNLQKQVLFETSLHSATPEMCNKGKLRDQRRKNTMYEQRSDKKRD